MNYLFLSQTRFEKYLEDELNLYKIKTYQSGDGFCLCEGDFTNFNKLSFPHYVLNNPVKITEESVNLIAGAIFDKFGEHIKEKQITEKYPVIFSYSQSLLNISDRLNSVKKQFMKILSKRMSKVSKFADLESDSGSNLGIFVYFIDFNTIFLSFDFFHNGQKRMFFDKFAPSRSYLKVEEAYSVFNIEPKENDKIVDLGAAPGGWSYSAAKRGAVVYAVDNGPLKDGAFDNEKIIHLKEDGIKYKPKHKFDFLFCDIIEQPKIIQSMLQKWIENKWCDKFIVNLKFGRTNPVELIKEINDKNSFFGKNCSYLKLIHLYHDREEFTLGGILK